MLSLLLLLAASDSSDFGSIIAGKWPPLKIYVYPLPNYFNTELLESQIRWGNNYSDYKHSMFHFWIEVELHRQLLKSPLVTTNPEEADIFYVPWYPTIGWFSGRLTSASIVINYLKKSGDWYSKFDGADHVITQAIPILPHPVINTNLSNELNCLIGSLDIDYNSSVDTWQGRKNLVVPYISYHPLYLNREDYWDNAKKNEIFIAMSPTTGRTNPSARLLRKQIFDVVANMSNSKVIMIDANNETQTQLVIDEIPYEMTRSKFCVIPAGDTPSSKRLYDAINYGCIPIVVSNNIQFAYEKLIVDYSKFVVQINESEAETIPDAVQRISDTKFVEMRNAMRNAAEELHFDVGGEPKLGDGFWSFSWMLYSKFAFMQPTKRRGLLNSE